MKSLSTQTPHSMGLNRRAHAAGRLLDKMMIRYLRRLWVVLRILPPFLKVAFSSKGLFCKDGRTLISGKARRSFISLVPPLANYLQTKHGLKGQCVSCGASCKLLFQCPHWDEDSHLCSVYEDRPDVCRQFPVTPKDITERNLVLKTQPCGFSFEK